MVGWTTNNQKPSSGGLEGNEMVMGLMLSQKSLMMQNCDLPPPLKVFAGPDKTVLSCMNRIFTLMGPEGEDNDELHISTTSDSENEKLELLKALRLSQTRAREAERQAAVLVKERDSLSNALLNDSSQLFAHRQWVRLLELQVSMLQRQQQQKHLCSGHDRSNRAGGSSKKGDDNNGGGSMTWFVAVALCLGFAFGCTYLF